MEIQWTVSTRFHLSTYFLLIPLNILKRLVRCYLCLQSLFLLFPPNVTYYDFFILDHTIIFILSTNTKDTVLLSQEFPETPQKTFYKWHYICLNTLFLAYQTIFTNYTNHRIVCSLNIFFLF